MLKRKGLRSGYTTGACAAAAAKAAVMLLLSKEKAEEIEIPFPDGSRVKFKIHHTGYNMRKNSAWASVIKDAGDDPDVTNGAEIMAEAGFQNREHGIQKTDKDSLSSDSCLLTSVLIKGGKGVGIVTKPGLPVAIGEPAINPVPKRMIKEAVMEAVQPSAISHQLSAIEVTISVTDGEELAKKTLNARLGIIGGISILGTTGIVRPISSEAWTATITSSMDVAKAMGHDTVVLSAGRASEKAHMKKYNFPEESYVMMGDYLEFALLEAKKHGFKEIHLCAQWAKTLKIAMATPQTHVRHGAIDIKKAVNFLKGLCSDFCILTSEFNTAREIFDFISTTPRLPNCLTPQLFFPKVCSAAKRFAEGIVSGTPVTTHLVSYEGDIIAKSE